VSGQELLRGLFMDVLVEEAGTRKCTCSTENSIFLFNSSELKGIPGSARDVKPPSLSTYIVGAYTLNIAD